MDAMLILMGRGVGATIGVGFGAMMVKAEGAEGVTERFNGCRVEREVTEIESPASVCKAAAAVGRPWESRCSCISWRRSRLSKVTLV